MRTQSTPLPDYFASNYQADRAKREAVTWRRSEGQACAHCGGLIMTGILDGELVANACQNCPATFAPTCPAGELASEWRAQG